MIQKIIVTILAILTIISLLKVRDERGYYLFAFLFAITLTAIFVFLR